ncbi:MAG: ATP-binding cassette domain-containing protein, partial [Lachnospiraceae bacterium]|nr:ATP-binding cassette domain-containing protein [Lachnospiraceae bacterium]
MLEFRNVCTNKKKFSLNNISFTAESGFITAITGTNGAGKTTLLSLITKEESKYTGEILFDGVDIRTDHDKFRGMLGIVCDERYFFDGFTANENVKLLSHFYPEWNNDIFKEQMKAMGISGGRKLSYLSRGEY